MTRPFDPRDVARVRGLQGAGCSLDYEGEILSGRSPLGHAVAGLVPWGDGRVITLVEPGRAETSDSRPTWAGFVQLRRRRGGRIADLIYVAPGLNPSAQGLQLWQPLLADASRLAGSRGAERLQVAVAADDLPAQHVLRQVGFASGSQDVVLGRAAGSKRRAGPLRTVLDAGNDLKEEVRRLTAAATGQRPASEAWSKYPVGGWMPPVCGLRTMMAPDGAVEAAWCIFIGARGAWLHIVALPAADPATAVDMALSDCESAAPNTTLYCAVPEPSTPLTEALLEAGFERVLQRVHLAKLTAARVIEPAWELRLAAERALDPATAGQTSALRRSA